MTFIQPQSLEYLARLIGARFVGPADFSVLGTNEIHRVNPGEMVFVNHPKYYKKALESKASVILIDKEVDCPPGKVLLISEDPFRDFNRINTHFTPIQTFSEQVSDTIIGEGSQIHPSVIIGSQVRIGRNCIIMPNVVLGDRTIIGDRCIIQAGTVIGGDAFYYGKTKGKYTKMLSVGYVVLEDEVEIGALCTVDRGVTDVTYIGRGTKLDNLIQVGHDTRIGGNCLIASQVGIAGCCTIGNQVTIWGQVGIASGKHIGDGAVIYGKAGVNRNLEGGKNYMGTFAEEYMDYLRREASLRKMTNNTPFNG